MQPAICRECGRKIDADFLFCPWCGEQLASKYYVSQRDEQTMRLDRIDQSLFDIENDLVMLLLHAAV